MNIKLIALACIGMLLFSCEGLEVDNLTDPNEKDVFNDPDEFNSFIDGQFNAAWWVEGHYYSHTLSTMGDGMSMSWGNWAAQDFSSEPRVAVDNSPTYNYAWVVEEPFANNYSAIGAANDILRIYLGDPSIQSKTTSGAKINYLVKAKAKYLQGNAYGNISKIYDKGKVVSEYDDLLEIDGVPIVDYKAMADSAVRFLDAAVEYANDGPVFTVSAWNGLAVGRDEFIKIIRSTQAKILVQNARNADENSNTDWNKVLQYSSQGVDTDFAPLGDGSVWWSPYIYYGQEAGWSRVDYRIISMLDPSQPSRFPTDDSHPLAPATSADNRLDSDLTYVESIPFRAERGLYHYSHYDYSRYDHHYPGATGSIPTITVAENDLMHAEALIRTGGDKSLAATLINNTRVGRGGLTALSGGESDAALLKALFYERFIELLGGSAGVTYYDRRRLPEDDGSYDPYSGLQPCTARNFPIPGQQLQLLGEAIYTYGGCND